MEIQEKDEHIGEPAGNEIPATKAVRPSSGALPAHRATSG